MLRRIAVAISVLLVVTAPAAAQRIDEAALEAGFQAWLANDMWPAAQASGITRATFDAAFVGIRPDFGLPELVFPGAGPEPVIDQPEFRAPAPYFGEQNLQSLARTGAALLVEWRETLAAIERQYGVPGPIVLAIWGRETVYGDYPLPHDAIRALATQAYLGRRAADARVELIAALGMLQSGAVNRSMMRSSWAGALGQPQLLPSGFLRYAVDFDRNGRRDIWTSVPDVLATIANLLAQNGWNGAEPWGVEVQSGGGDVCAAEGPTTALTLSGWQDLGIAVPEGIGGFRNRNDLWHLLAPAGALGPSFLVTDNFYVIKEYNFSDLYALFVAHLADRIAGANRTFAAPWQEIPRIDHGQVQRMQQRLEALGYDVGGADGLVGFRTRVAIGRFQAAAGLPVTCFPNAAVFAALG